MFLISESVVTVEGNEMTAIRGHSAMAIHGHGAGPWLRDLLTSSRFGLSRRLISLMCDSHRDLRNIDMEQ